MNRSPLLILALLMLILTITLGVYRFLWPSKNGATRPRGPALPSSQRDAGGSPGAAESGPAALLSLCPDGLSFCTGEAPIVLRGVNLPSLIFADSVIDFGTLPLFKEEVNIVKEWGATFAVISYDPWRAAHRPYAEKIVEAVEYTRGMGLFVELMQHHAHFDPQTAVVTPHIPIQDENSLELATDVGRRWMDLLSHPGFAERLGRSVDIFGIYSEPAGISWRRWRPRAEKICLDIRARIGRETVCSISGTARGWDVRGLLFDPFQIGSVVVEVHNYQGYETTLNRHLNWSWLVGRVPLLVGEFGYTDPPGYIERLLGELRAKGISWAAWPGEPILWAQVPNLDRLVREELAR